MIKRRQKGQIHQLLPVYQLTIINTNFPLKWYQCKFNIKISTQNFYYPNNPFDLQLRNHKLKGKRIGCRSLDVMGDLRIIFRELSEGKYELVELIELGSHSQLY